MQIPWFLRLIFGLSILFYTVGICRYSQENGLPVKWFLTSYSYQGPTEAIPGNPKLIRVEVIIRDSPKAGGLQIQSVTFNGKNIPLQPRDIYGNRGTGSFQVPPGKYKLKWVVQRDKPIWPRIKNREEEVTLDPRDLWLQIEIVGDEASIR